jgi:hypothetical protein
MAGITLFVLTTVLVTLTTVSGHSYHLGNCPNVESQQNFDMEKVSKIIELVQSKLHEILMPVTSVKPNLRYSNSYFLELLAYVLWKAGSMCYN